MKCNPCTASSFFFFCSLVEHRELVTTPVANRICCKVPLIGVMQVRPLAPPTGGCVDACLSPLHATACVRYDEQILFHMLSEQPEGGGSVGCPRARRVRASIAGAARGGRGKLLDTNSISTAITWWAALCSRAGKPIPPLVRT